MKHEHLKKKKWIKLNKTEPQISVDGLFAEPLSLLLLLLLLLLLVVLVFVLVLVLVLVLLLLLLLLLLFGKILNLERAGDALYLPCGWWHAVVGSQDH